MEHRLDSHRVAAIERPRSLTGLQVLGLAALGVPRVVLHDLELLSGGNPLTGVLAIGPPAVWIWLALSRRLHDPLGDLVRVGLAYGGMLAATHQALWSQAYDDEPPRLGGSLAGALSDGLESLVIRAFSLASSLTVGFAVGVVCGTVARALRRRSEPVRTGGEADRNGPR